jgi:hypothetical protein
MTNIFFRPVMYLFDYCISDSKGLNVCASDTRGWKLCGVRIRTLTLPVVPISYLFQTQNWKIAPYFKDISTESLRKNTYAIASYCTAWRHGGGVGQLLKKTTRWLRRWIITRNFEQIRGVRCGYTFCKNTLMCLNYLDQRDATLQER